MINRFVNVDDYVNLVSETEVILSEIITIKGMSKQKTMVTVG